MGTKHRIPTPEERAKRKPRGHRQKIVIIDYEKVETLAGRGLQMQQIADYLGIKRHIIFARKKDDEKFKEAMAVGKAKAIAACTAKMMSHIEKGSVVALIFWLKSQAGWKETSVVETREAPPIPESDCTSEEAEAIYIETMKSLQ